MKNLVCLLVIVVANFAFSQEGKLVGKVVDEKGEPVMGASVIYKKDLTIGANADDQGNYTIELPTGEVKLICRYTAMITDTFYVTILENKTVTHDIVLKQFVLEIEGVEVKVGKFDKALEDQTVSMEILRPEMIENKNTRSIETALDQTPGLNILDGEPQIRGGSGFTFGVGSKVAVIVDDMPMLSGDAGRPEWGFIPVENIHQIEIIKGAASVLSGSSALSGSVHIRTAYPKAKPKTKVNVYAGMYSKPNQEGATWWDNFPLISGANFLHSRMIGNLDLVIGGNVNYDHGYIGAPVLDSSIQVAQNGKFADTVSNFTERQMSSQRARINFNIRHRSKRYKGLSYGVNGNFMYSEANLAFAWLGDSSDLFKGYPGAVFLQKQLIFNVDPFLTVLTQTNGKHYFRTRLLYAHNDMTAGQSNEAATYYGDYMYQKSFANLFDLDFIGGITGTYTNSFANIYVGSGSSNNQLMNLSAYTQLEKKFKETINLSLGGRLEYFQLNDSITALKPIFRAGTSIKLYQETYLRASYGQGYRFPTITERFIRTGVGNLGVFPNQDLKPETSWNAEVGIKQGLKFGKIYGYLDVAGFWQQYQNTIEYMFGYWGSGATPSDLAGFRFMNTGESRVLGIDASFSGKAKIGKKVDVMFITGYNYIVPKSLNPDNVYWSGINALSDSVEYTFNSTSLNPEEGILKYRFLHNIKGDIEFTFNKKFSVGMSVKYFSKIENMDIAIRDFEELTELFPYIQNIEYMDFYNSHRHGNWIFDARLSYQINEKHKVAVISANVANRVYSLRPLKIEQPRTVMIQYSFNLDRN